MSVFSLLHKATKSVFEAYARKRFGPDFIPTEEIANDNPSTSKSSIRSILTNEKITLLKNSLSPNEILIFSPAFYEKYSYGNDELTWRRQDFLTITSGGLRRLQDMCMLEDYSNGKKDLVLKNVRIMDLFRMYMNRNSYTTKLQEALNKALARNDSKNGPNWQIRDLDAIPVFES